ncbi:MAG: OB-fold nucleic acid binding domain-containing protein [Archaeoglobaceae archaeon]|nr:OB-fold nucleic acid binding domain-containing protein [Archaeoglobaceae archaeon]MDW8118541.1 OB-fold nucleic acid binding domain-containing protein [Archaeoglobaceae archaeon]
MDKFNRLKEIKDRFGDLIDEKTAEELANYSPNSQEFVKISEILPGKVNVRGRVSGIGDPDLANEIYLSDESGRVRVLIWDKEIYYKAEIGMRMEIYNGYAKEGKNGIEIHVNKYSIVKFLE